MKKLAVFLAATTLLSTPVLSQQWRIAPTASLNASTISYSRSLINNLKTSAFDVKTGVRAGFQVGAYIDRSFSERVSIRSGLLYTSKGGRLTLTSTRVRSASGQINITLNYLEVPLLLNVAVGQRGLRLIGGPVLSITLNGKSVAQASNNGTSLGSETINMRVGEDVNDDLRPTDFSVSLGLIKQFDVGSRPLELGLHIQPSLRQWNPVSRINSSDTAYNLMAGLRVAYLFDLTR